MSVHPRAAAEMDAGFTTSGPTSRSGHAMPVDPAQPALIGVGADRSGSARFERSNRWEGVSNARHSGSQPAVHATRPATSAAHSPTIVETGELILFVDMIVIGATIMPGFLLCVPALALILVPVVALGLVAAAAGLVILLVTAPVRLGWRGARRLRHAVAARRAPGALIGAPSELTRRRASRRTCPELPGRPGHARNQPRADLLV